MGISEVTPGSDLSDSNNEKGELQYVENTVTVSPSAERVEDGKLTKETILAYVVRSQSHPRTLWLECTADVFL